MLVYVLFWLRNAHIQCHVSCFCEMQYVLYVRKGYCICHRCFVVIFSVMKTIKCMSRLEREWASEKHREAERKSYQKRKLVNPELVKLTAKLKKRRQRAMPGYREREKKNDEARLKKKKAVEAFAKKQEAEIYRRLNPKMTRRYAAMICRAGGKSVSEKNLREIMAKQYKV